MKRLFITLIAIAGWLQALCALQTTDFFAENFWDMGQDSDYPSADWLTLGNGAIPTEAAATYFNADGSGPFFTLLSYGDQMLAMANTEFEDGAEADQWLISPLISVPYDNAALLFTACAFANKGQDFGVGLNTFRILVSEGGTAKEDFSEVALESSVRGSASTYLTSKKLVAPINGHKDRKIRIAFVVSGSNVGLTGFTDLRMGQYIMDVTDYTTDVAQLDVPENIDINIGLKAPVVCDYVDVTLELDGELAETKEFKKTFGSPTSNIMVMQRIIFENAVTLKDDTPVSYRVTLTPRFDGALPTILTGSLATPGSTYPANVVIEEATATGCVFCPRGTASLAYYLDTYPGSDSEGKAIAIAIHGYQGYYDPMSQGVEEYLTLFSALNGTAALPGAMFNRATRGLDPSYATEVQKLMTERSYNDARILSVDLPPYSSAEDLAGKSVDVKFNVRNGYNSSNRALSAALVVVENDVVGHDSGYNQANYYANCSEQQAADLHGSFLLPYLAPYLKGGELGMSTIPAPLMTYQHVARGIFPGFYGEELPKEWQSDVAQEFTLSFEMPATVSNPDKTEVILLVIDDETASIVASDIMPASAYTPSGVDMIEDSAAAHHSVSASDGVIRIEAPAGTRYSVITIDGLEIASGYASDSATLLPTDHRGILIVRLTGDGPTHRLLLN